MNEEHAIIEKIRDGDERAFRKLYERHVDSLFRFMRQYSKNTVQVEDWVQRAFIKAFRSIHTFNLDSRFSTWLFAIALNEMRTDFRRPNLIVFDSAGASELRASEREDDAFIWEGMMRTWLDELDESKRTVFVLYEVEGYSHAEIGSMLHIGESTSRTLLHRAKQYLKGKWETEEKSA